LSGLDEEMLKTDQSKTLPHGKCSPNDHMTKGHKYVLVWYISYSALDPLRKKEEITGDGELNKINLPGTSLLQKGTVV